MPYFTFICAGFYLPVSCWGTQSHKILMQFCTVPHFCSLNNLVFSKYLHTFLMQFDALAVGVQVLAAGGYRRLCSVWRMPRGKLRPLESPCRNRERCEKQGTCYGLAVLGILVLLHVGRSRSWEWKSEAGKKGGWAGILVFIFVSHHLNLFQ